MEIAKLLQSIIEADEMPVVACDLSHTIVYMNPAAVKQYEKRGGAALVGRNLLDCHNEHSGEIIRAVVQWFGESCENNRAYTSRNSKENKDVYMIALRDEKGELIGYTEKHEVRTPESAPFFELPGREKI